MKGDEEKWPYGGAIDAAKSFGANVVEKNVNEVSQNFTFGHL